MMFAISDIPKKQYKKSSKLNNKKKLKRQKTR